MSKINIIVGDCRQRLEELEPKSVQCCITSPPYFGLRDYDAEGQIGLEDTPDQFVAQLVRVFQGVRRVLRDDGTLWVVIGDSYASGTTAIRSQAETSTVGNWSSPANNIPRNGNPPGVKTKDLIGVPWMLAFALRADGWYLRSDIIWDKPNVMPESVTDRPTKAHEYIFLLSKSENYFYDHEAIKEPTTTDEGRPPGIVRDRELGYDSKEAVVRKRPSVKRGGFNGKFDQMPGREPFRAVTDMRNKRTVWKIKTQPYPGAHYAVYPPKLIEPCMLAGTSPQACELCGAPWSRVLGEPIPGEGRGSGNLERKYRGDHGGLFDDPHRRSQGFAVPWSPSSSPTIGWEPTCRCEGTTGSALCVVLDPFNGAGTTGLVADRHGRDYIGIEINPEYAEQARRRIHSDAPLFAEP